MSGSVSDNLKWLGLLFPLLVIILSLGYTPYSSNIPQLDDQLRELARRGYSYRWLNDELIEIQDNLSGSNWLKSLNEPTLGQILAWADTEGVPVLEIDPTEIDTSLYEGWYVLWTEVPISNASLPVVVGDADGDQRPEFYGSFKDYTTDFQTRVYEIDSVGVATLVHNYEPRPGVARQFADVDQDTLIEITFSLAGVVSDFEQRTLVEIPTELNFCHEMFRSSVHAIFSGIFIGAIDDDDLTDFLYSGSEEDSIFGGLVKTYVAEYNADSNDFIRLWSAEFSRGTSGTCGYSVFDFDSDGLMEFVVSNLAGPVYVVENSGDNEYEVVWQDSLPFQSLCYHSSGDVDGDGHSEFFVGATTSSGNWITAFEADSNDSYSAKALFHFPWGGLGENPTLLTDDLSGDGRSELIVTSANNIFVLTSISDDNYALWYFQPVSFFLNSVQTYQFGTDDTKSFIVSGDTADSVSRLRLFCRVYRPADLLAVDRNSHEPSQSIVLLRNYPNPFNSDTRIICSTPVAGLAEISIFNILGEKIESFTLDGAGTGTHSLVWNPGRIPSGVYIARLTIGRYSAQRKMLLVR